VGHNETARARLEWNVYPIGIPFLVVPLTWMADKIAAAFGIDLEAAAVRKSPLLLELLFASLITAAAAALLFWYLRQRLSLRRSLLLGALFALGTSAYSSASRGLWQHGPSMLLLVSAVIVYERLDKWRWPGAVFLGFCAGYSYAVRPANLIVALGFAALLLPTARRRLMPYVCGVVLGVVPLFAFSSGSIWDLVKLLLSDDARNYSFYLYPAWSFMRNTLQPVTGSLHLQSFSAVLVCSLASILPAQICVNASGDSTSLAFGCLVDWNGAVARVVGWRVLWPATALRITAVCRDPSGSSRSKPFARWRLDL